MKFIRLTPMLWTMHLQETINFYTTKLGFTCGDRNDEWGWAAMHRDGVEIMIARPNDHASFDHPKFTGSFYINVDNVDELWNQLKDEVYIAYPIEDFEWKMREFAIHDNNGFIIQFGQDIS